ncbi:LacI family transcriptional regulator [Allocatelliglobosispora scoriae]|uniref:LacI family transcriptional regulator n=1 Tax=Allocatelliglobosispora scoriae TaxID=643052 RepID=A0A841C3L3_9ACTN|nr:LacI family DNA-binding transcriptional regulator [Allocatelliglobosispora scoriae]MBB5874506.1 LacI family transcriptional regulator [Allocatelliglobosispora scoriae]
MLGDEDPMRLPPGRARLSDVARLAGVSAKTVSRVITGHHNVSPSTRERVLEAAQRLRFRPNHLARDLRQGGVSRTVAFVMGDLKNPFYSHVAAGIERFLAEHGLTMVLAATGDDPAQEARVVGAMLERRVHSLLLVPIAGDQSYLAGEQQLGTPVICIDRPAHNLAADSVVFANRAGAAEAVQSLLAHGHRRIAFIGSAMYTHDERLAGYRQALLEAGVAAVPQWERQDAVTAADAERVVRELLAGPVTPTAILAGNNRVSTGVLRALRDVPQQVAFIGFDDFDLADTLGVTVVTHDPERMGREAVSLAIARSSDLYGPPLQTVIPTQLVLRGSGEVPPDPASLVR